MRVLLQLVVCCCVAIVFMAACPPACSNGFFYCTPYVGQASLTLEAFPGGSSATAHLEMWTEGNACGPAASTTDVSWLRGMPPGGGIAPADIWADASDLPVGIYVGHVDVSACSDFGGCEDAVCTVTLYVYPFPDTPASTQWAWREIAACSTAGVVNGYDDGLYRPDAVVSRDQMAVYIRRAMFMPEGGVRTPFPDVPSDFWAVRDIQALVGAGVVQGYDDGLYHPELPVTRDQMCVYVARAMDYGPTAPAQAVFPDVPADFWAAPEIKACVNNHVVQGFDDGYFMPAGDITRDQMAVYLARALWPRAEVDLEHSNAQALSLWVGLGHPADPSWRRQVWPVEGQTFQGATTLRFDLADRTADWLNDWLNFFRNTPGEPGNQWFLESYDSRGDDVGSIHEFRLMAGNRMWEASGPLATEQWERGYLFIPPLDDPKLWVQRHLGWPVNVDARVRAPVTVGDLDGDGRLEVVAVVDSWPRSVYVWDADGRLLPGWPVSLGSPDEIGAPMLADLDGDGDLEIVIAAGRFSAGLPWGPVIYAFHHDGSVLPGWPVAITPGVWGPMWTSAPAAGDLDGDGNPEVVLCSTEGSVSAFDTDGALLPGWPVSMAVQGWLYATPAVGDLDGDGRAEVVVMDSGAQGWVLRGDGSVADGWPVDNSTGESVCPSSPVLADIDGDGRREAIFLAGGHYYAYDYQGQLVESGPILHSPNGSPAIAEMNGAAPPEVVPLPEGADPTGYWSPLVADLDGDGVMDIVNRGVGSLVYLVTAEGDMLKWPVPLPGEASGTGAVGDLEGDGTLELVVGTYAGTIHAWRFPGPATPAALQWPMFQHDAQHTGTYVTP